MRVFLLCNSVVPIFRMRVCQLPIFWLPIFWLVDAAVDDYQGAEAGGGVGHGGVWFGRGKQDGGEKHGEAGDASGPTVPEAKGQNYERSACYREQDAEGEPASAIAAEIQELRHEQDEREESAEGEIAEPGGSGFLRGSDWG